MKGILKRLLVVILFAPLAFIWLVSFLPLLLGYWVIAGKDSDEVLLWIGVLLDWWLREDK